MTRSEAKRLGLQFYNTEKPCKHGHLSDRRTKSGICLACEPMYARRYYADGRSHAGLKRARLKHSAKIVARVQQWRKQNPERYKAHNAAYRKRHLERVKAASNRWTRANKDKVKAWRLANIERCRENLRNAKARRKAAPGKHTAADVRRLYTMQKGRCAYCRISLRDGYHVDHIQPIKLGGSNDRTNLQLLCVSCNTSKGAKHPIDYARSRGLLL